MINPTWQDMDRRIIYIPTEYIKLPNPMQYALGKDHGELIMWTEAKVTVKLDGKALSINCQPHNLFWEDESGDFDELKSLKEK